MSAGSIVLDLLLRTGSFITDTKRAEKAVKDFEGSAKKLGDTFLKIAGFASAGAAVAKITQEFHQAVDAMDAFNDLKDATGASIENISALDAVARRTGGTFETVESSLIKFNKVLSEAGGKNATTEVLKAIGLSAEELKRIDPAEALRQTAVALSQFADDGNKARVIQELFGKSIKEAAPFLKDLAEQGSLVAKTTTEQAQAAEDYNKALYQFGAAAEDFKRSAVSAIIPALNEMIAQFKDALAGYSSFGNAVRSAQFNATQNPFSNATEQISATREALAGLKKDLADREAAIGSFEGNTLEVSTKKAKIDDIKAEIAALKEREAILLLSQARSVKQASYSNEGGVRAPGAASLPSAPDTQKLEDARKAREAAEKAAQTAGDAAHKQAERYIDDLRKQFEKTKDLTNVEQLRADIAAKRVKPNAAQLKEAEAAAKLLDLYTEEKRRLGELSAAQEALIESRLRVAEAAEGEAQSLVADNEALKLEIAYIGKDADALLALEQARIASTIATKQATLSTLEAGGVTTKESEAIRLQIEALKERAGLLDKSFSLSKAAEEFTRIKELSKQAEDTIKGALGDTLEQALTGNFDGILKAWGSMIIQMANKAIAADLMASLTGGKGGNTSALWSGLANFAGSFFGNSSPVQGGTGFGDYNDLGSVAHLATGTDYVPKDMLAVVHEGERVVPKAFNPAAGNGNDGNVTLINNGPPMTATQSNERGPDGKQLKKIVLEMIKQDINSGGQVGKSIEGRYGVKSTLPRRG